MAGPDPILILAGARLAIEPAGGLTTPIDLTVGQDELVVLDLAGPRRSAAFADAVAGVLPPGEGHVMFLGRDWRDEKDPRFHGLGKVRATVRGRLTLGLSLSERWSLTSRASQDLLGRDGGLRLDTGLNYRQRLSRDTHWDLSFGAGWANGTFRQTHYGISPEGAAATGLPAYAIGSGWDSLSMGWRITSALNRHWVGYAGLGMAQLQGAARRSPLATRPTTYSAAVGLAYRNR